MSDKPEKNNEWFTPSKYIEAARTVMDGIDLDPASCEQANQIVQAKRYYTKEQNGLMQPWAASGHKVRVWLNPPYGRTIGGISMSHQKAFAQKLLLEYALGNVEQAVLLSLGNPNSVWFQPFFDYPLCFNTSHIDFYRPDGSTGSFGFPLAFAYLGPNESTFISVFSRFGRVVRAVDTPTPKPVMLDLWTPETAIQEAS